MKRNRGTHPYRSSYLVSGKKNGSKKKKSKKPRLIDRVTGKEKKLLIRWRDPKKRVAIFRKSNKAQFGIMGILDRVLCGKRAFSRVKYFLTWAGSESLTVRRQAYRLAYASAPRIKSGSLEEIKKARKVIPNIFSVMEAGGVSESRYLAKILAEKFRPALLPEHKSKLLELISKK